MNSYIEINHRRIGLSESVYIVAEMSANHNQDFEQAVRILKAAKEAGADALKIQTYTADTMTISCDNDYFRIGEGTIWEGKNLYGLYEEAFTPWEWQPRLAEIARDIDMDLFSTPFDYTAVEFLESFDMLAYKIASFEVVDLPLLRCVAATGKPVIMSTGMSTLAEIDEAVRTLRSSGNEQLVLLKCTSAYPARPEEMNLRTIPHLSESFGVPVGLSDHTLSVEVPVAAVALGACVVEKHFTLSRSIAGPDSAFSLEPEEFAEMVRAVRSTQGALGTVQYEVGQKEEHSRSFRRSLFVVEDMEVGDKFTAENVRTIRPAHGLHPRFLPDIIGKRSSRAIDRGTPVDWSLVSST